MKPHNDTCCPNCRTKCDTFTPIALIVLLVVFFTWKTILVARAEALAARVEALERAERAP